ncbi:MAG: hypothetical protein ACP5N1_05115 [Candidatus Woesearchaeota archaeon]
MIFLYSSSNLLISSIISGLDLNVVKYLPELIPLAEHYYEPNFWKTFHM